MVVWTAGGRRPPQTTHSHKVLRGRRSKFTLNLGHHHCLLVGVRHACVRACASACGRVWNGGRRAGPREEGASGKSSRECFFFPLHSLSSFFFAAPTVRLRPPCSLNLSSFHAHPAMEGALAFLRVQRRKLARHAQVRVAGNGGRMSMRARFVLGPPLSPPHALPSPSSTCPAWWKTSRSATRAVEDVEAAVGRQSGPKQKPHNGMPSLSHPHTPPSSTTHRSSTPSSTTSPSPTMPPPSSTAACAASATAAWPSSTMRPTSGARSWRRERLTPTACAGRGAGLRMTTVCGRPAVRKGGRLWCCLLWKRRRVVAVCPGRRRNGARASARPGPPPFLSTKAECRRRVTTARRPPRRRRPRAKRR